MAKIIQVAMLGGHPVVDGKPIALDELESVLGVAAREGAGVHYYTDQPGTPGSMNLMKLVAKHQLPIQFASKPDFSDVVPLDELSAARATASAGRLVIIRPDASFLVLPCSTDGVPPQAVAGIKQMIPPPQNVAVIGSTAWTAEPNPSLDVANEAIPFFGMLIGASAVGNSVWISDGHRLAPGCLGADLLIVDSDRLPALPADWKPTAAAAMRRPAILIHDRAQYRLRPA